MPMIWDEANAVATVGGDRGLALAMLTELIASLPMELRTFERLLQGARLDELAERAHRYRGGAAYCGVPDLIAALTALEKSARAGSRGQTEQAMAAVADATANLQRLDLDAITQ